MQLRFEHDTDGGNYVVWLEGDDSGRPAGLISCRDQGPARDLAHGGASRPAGARNRGQAHRHAISDIREAGLELIPGCPYIHDYVVRHPEDQELCLPPGARPTASDPPPDPGRCRSTTKV